MFYHVMDTFHQELISQPAQSCERVITISSRRPGAIRRLLLHIFPYLSACLGHHCVSAVAVVDY